MKKVLLIEDNIDIRENMSEIMEMAGYEVFTAENGKLGVESAIQNNPDIIVCDIMMPVLDGYGVLLMLQKNNATQQIPFIFLSAKGERSEIRKGMELGADDYITKPFEGTELLNAIDVRLKKSNLLRQEMPANMSGVNTLIAVNSGRDVLKDLKDEGHTDYFKKKEIIYSEGHHPQRLYYIEKGKVKVFKRNDDGKELIIGLYNSGDFFGYANLLENAVYRDNAQAMEETELSIIPRSDFDKLVNSNPEVLRKLVQLLTHNVMEKEEQLLGIAYNSLRKKVADALVTLYRKYNPGNNENFTIDISRENLASIAGVAKESLIRTLSDFKDEKLITLNAATIAFLQIKKLEQMFN